MRFGRYRPLETLGQRGAVLTCRAREDVQDRTVILKMLYSDATGNLESVHARGTSDAVVEILIERGARLSASERDTLGALASVGGEFSLTGAQVATPAEPEKLQRSLEAAVAMGRDTPVFDLREDASEPGRDFLHDRVREAAAALQSPEARRATHARLAALRPAADEAPPRGDRLFAVARHLKEALGPDASPDEIARARGLNAAAGGDAGAALLVGGFDEMRARLETFLANCPDPAGRARILTLELFANLAQNRAMEATEAGRKALAALGESLPDNPGPAEIEAGVGGVCEAHAGRQIHELPALPEVSDPAHAALHKVPAAVLFPGLWSQPAVVRRRRRPAGVHGRPVATLTKRRPACGGLSRRTA